MTKKIDWKYVREKSEEWFRWCAFSCVVLLVVIIVADMDWDGTKLPFFLSIITFATYKTFFETGRECFMKDNKK